jgi:hypothetical protein
MASLSLNWAVSMIAKNTKLESGIRPVADIEIIAIARVLKIPVTLLFEGSEE